MKNICLLLVILLKSFNLLAGPDSLALRVKALEQKIDSMRLSEITAKELNLKIDQKDFEIRKDYNWLINHGFTFGFAGLIAFLAILYKMYNDITDAAKKKAQVEINRYLDNEDNQLKNEKRILVLTPTGGKTEFVSVFFRKMGFRIPDYSTMDQPGYSFNQYDLILLNDETVKLSADKVHEVTTEAGEKISVLYFGNLTLKPETKSCKNFASVQIKSQLYPNLLNALRFQKML